MSKLNYIFIAAPTNLVYTMEGDLLKLLLILIREQTEWLNRGDSEDGLFEYSIISLSKDMNASRNTIKLMLDTLFDAELIFVVSPKNDKTTFNINWKKIIILENSARNSIEYLIQKKGTKTFNYLQSNSEKHLKIWDEIDDYFTNFYGKKITKTDIKNWKKSVKFDQQKNIENIDIEELNSFQNSQNRLQIKDKRKEIKETKNIETENIITENIKTRNSKYQILQTTNSTNGSVECCSVFDGLPF